MQCHSTLQKYKVEKVPGGKNIKGQRFRGLLVLVVALACWHFLKMDEPRTHSTLGSFSFAKRFPRCWAIPHCCRPVQAYLRVGDQLVIKLMVNYVDFKVGGRVSHQELNKVNDQKKWVKYWVIIWILKKIVWAIKSLTYLGSCFIK